jgi:BirA family transcriptional regulator, biotin operon repressor / biotin---[acetyl-CoA-carboxylase] ligase
MLGPRIGNKIITLEETDSTNSHAARLLQESRQEEGTVILAHFQNAGRGQRGGGWESLPGENLLASYILYPTFLNALDQFLLNQCIALAVKDTIEQLTKSSAYIKWPNDIISNGSKVAGILIENALRGNKLSHSIAGIGINVNQTVFLPYQPPASSIARISGKSERVEMCLTVLSDNLDKWYTSLKLGQIQKIRSAYNQYLFRKDAPSVFISSTGTFSGIITGVTEEGKLEVNTEGKTLQVFDIKELKLLTY